MSAKQTDEVVAERKTKTAPGTSRFYSHATMNRIRRGGNLPPATKKGHPIGYWTIPRKTDIE